VNDASPKAFDAFVAADKAKRGHVEALTGMVLITIVIVVLLGCMTSYCSQPKSGTPIDREAQAARIIENNKMMACLRTRGSWMPVVVRYESGASDTQMSCVTDAALPLVQSMNKKGN